MPEAKDTDSPEERQQDAAPQADAAVETPATPQGDGAAAAPEGEQPGIGGESATAPAAPVDAAPAAEAASGETQSDAEKQAAEAEQERRGRGRGARSVPAGIAHIKATFNNTMVSITDVSGGVIAWSSSGRAGFRGSRKSTSFAATLVGQEAARQAVGRGMHEVEVRVQGAGGGRESAIRALQSAGLNITVIKDVTPIPHNGCRPRKRRRV